MRSVLSAVVSYHDLKNYFAGDHWSFQVQDNGSIKATSEAYEVNLTPKASKFNVTIRASDDPSDSESGVTDDPVSFIKKFLSTGPGSEDLLKKLSFVTDPDSMSELLRRAALMVEISPGEMPQVRRMLRRGIVAFSGNGVERLLVAVVRAVAGAGDDAIEVRKLTKEMKEKGWKVEQTDDDGIPVLKVDLSGLYTADIRLQETTWGYSFKVNEMGETEESGTTDDPIGKFQKYYRSEPIKEARQTLKEKRESEPDDNTDPEGTVAPGKGKPKKKEKKPSGPPDEGTEKTIMAPTALPPSRVPNMPKGNKYSDEE